MLYNSLHVLVQVGGIVGDVCGIYSLLWVLRVIQLVPPTKSSEVFFSTRCRRGQSIDDAYVPTSARKMGTQGGS